MPAPQSKGVRIGKKTASWTWGGTRHSGEIISRSEDTVTVKTKNGKKKVLKKKS